tara:strand:+ start:1322 stop:1915 length:594 start_codon:yes stop_codon:yes gene_type:complete
MRKFTTILLFTLSLLHATSGSCQLQQFNEQRCNIDKKLMLSLGSWASANIIGSGIGWATTDNDEHKYFHQMNVFWNAINIGLAIPGYMKARNGKSQLSLFKTLEEQRIIEGVHLVNAGLDLAYISSGILLRNKQAKNSNEENQFRGYGNSIIIQGGFLLVYDWIGYMMHRKHARKQMNPLLQKIEPSSSGIGFILHL